MITKYTKNDEQVCTPLTALLYTKRRMGHCIIDVLNFESMMYQHIIVYKK